MIFLLTEARTNLFWKIWKETRRKKWWQYREREGSGRVCIVMYIEFKTVEKRGSLCFRLWLRPNVSIANRGSIGGNIERRARSGWKISYLHIRMEVLYERNFLKSFIRCAPSQLKGVVGSRKYLITCSNFRLFTVKFPFSMLQFAKLEI